MIKLLINNIRTTITLWLIFFSCLILKLSALAFYEHLYKKAFYFFILLVLTCLITKPFVTLQLKYLLFVDRFTRKKLCTTSIGKNIAYFLGRVMVFTGLFDASLYVFLLSSTIPINRQFLVNSLLKLFLDVLIANLMLLDIHIAVLNKNE